MLSLESHFLLENLAVVEIRKSLDLLHVIEIVWIVFAQNNLIRHTLLDLFRQGPTFVANQLVQTCQGYPTFANFFIEKPNSEHQVKQFCLLGNFFRIVQQNKWWQYCSWDDRLQCSRDLFFQAEFRALNHSVQVIVYKGYGFVPVQQEIEDSLIQQTEHIVILRIWNFENFVYQVGVGLWLLLHNLSQLVVLLKSQGLIFFCG